MITRIYVLCEPQGEIRYIGKTICSLNRRFTSHLVEAREGKPNHKCNWIRSLLSKGLLPVIQLIGEVVGNGNEEEKSWIAYGKAEGWRLINQTNGGDGGGMLGRVVSSQTRHKISIANIGKRRPPETIARLRKSHKGHKPSEETIRKILESRRGYKHSPETIEKIRIANTGHKASLETIEKLKNRKASLETRQKMSESAKKRFSQYDEKEKQRKRRLGKHLSLETRKKLSIVLTGRIVSPETRLKISEFHKGMKYTGQALENIRKANYINSQSRIGTKYKKKVKTNDCDGIIPIRII